MPPDLYTQWLLIPPGPRPPNYYALLGLPPFSGTGHEIEEAAGRQLERLDRYALHPDVTTRESCQRMMNEVAKARVILVSPEKRRLYDDELISHGFQLPVVEPAPPPLERGVRGVAEVVEPEPHAEEVHEELPPVEAGILLHMAATQAAAAQVDLHPELAGAAQAAQYKKVERMRHPGRGIALAAAGFIVALAVGFLTFRHFHHVSHKATETIARTGPNPSPLPPDIATAQPKPPKHTSGEVSEVQPHRHHDKSPESVPAVPGETKPPTQPSNPAVATQEPAGSGPDNKLPEFFGVRGRPDGPGTLVTPETTPPKNKPAENPQKTTATPVVATTTPAASPPAIAGNSSKVAVPDAAAQEKEARAIEEAYKDDLAGASGREGAIALSQRLLEAGIEKQGDPAARYALFGKARDLAQQAGDSDAAMSAVTQMESGYFIDGVKMKSDVLMAIVSNARSLDERRSLARDAIPIIDESLNTDRYEVARPLAEAALVAARESNDWQTARDIVVRVLEIRSGVVAYNEYRKASATLGAAPDNPSANLTVGLYQCVWKGDWPHGLGMVARGGDTALKDLALREINGISDAGAQVQAGDDWWTYGEKQESIVRQKIRAHAGFWYRQALPNLDGLTRDRVERRLAAIGRMAIPDVSMADAVPKAPAIQATGMSLARGPAASMVPVARIRTDVAPIPSADDQAEAEKQIAKFAEGLNFPTGQDPRRILADHVWEAASAAAKSEKPDPKDLPGRYVLLLESVRLATETGQYWIMSHAADLLGKDFAVDVLDLKFQAFTRSDLMGGGEPRQRQLIEGTGELRDEAMDRKEYAMAFKFAGLAGALAHRSTDPALAAAVQAANARLDDWPQVQAAITTLEGKPADPDANLTLGRFLCFVTGNWKEGLKNLAQGPDGRFKTLAGTELKVPASAEDQKALADGWWDASTQNPIGQMQLELHAAQWYRKALPELPSSLQGILTSRIRGLNRYNSQLPAIGDPRLPDDPRMPEQKAAVLLTMDTGAGLGNYSASFSPDGRHIIAIGQDRFWVFDSTTGDAVGPPTVVCEPPQNKESRPVFLDASGTRIIALGGNGKTVTVWDVTEQKQIGTTITKDDMVDADISPDGRLIVTANGWSPAGARLWDLSSGKRIGAVMSSRERITCVRFSADGKYVLTAGADRACQVWNGLNGASLSQMGAGRDVDLPQGASFDPSGKFVGMLYHNGAMVIWETASGRSLMEVNTGTWGQAMAFSPNGLYLAGGGAYRYLLSHPEGASGAVQVFDLSNGKSLAGLLKHDGGGKDIQGGPSLSFSHDSRYLVTSSPYGRTARVWDIKKGAVLVVAPLEHLQTVTSVGFDLPGRHVVTACADGTVRVWELPG